MNKSPQYKQWAKSEQCSYEVEEMHLSKPGNWSSISENTGAILESPFEGTISESTEIKK